LLKTGTITLTCGLSDNCALYGAFDVLCVSTVAAKAR
jgi:hypothetical protein